MLVFLCAGEGIRTRTMSVWLYIVEIYPGLVFTLGVLVPIRFVTGIELVHYS